MILNIKMLKQNCFILAAVVLAGALSFSCFLFNLGDGGTLVVQLPGGDGSARALMDGFDRNGYLNELKYRITCSGQGSTAEREASAGGSVTLYLPAGRWDFTVTVINKNGREIGSDTRIVNIEDGKSVTVNDIMVQLDEPIYMFTNTFNIEQNNWATGNGNYCLKNYYSRTFVEDKQYRVNIKGTINVPMDDINLMLWLYTGSNPSADYNAADWKIIGHTWGSLNQKYLKNHGDFDATLDLLIDFNIPGYVLTPADKNLLKEPDRIYFELTSKMEKDIADINWVTKKTAITHFNMIISDGMIIDMYGWSGSGSGWTSGYNDNMIKVIPDYLNSIKPNTQYKVTVKGRTNTDLRGMDGQFWWAGNMDATNWNATYCLDNNIPVGEFYKEIYLTTNNSITSQNQKEIIFNIVSNWQNTPSADSGKKMATISDFTMGIEEVTDVVYMRATYWDNGAKGNYTTSEQIKIVYDELFEFGKTYVFHIEGVSSRDMEDLWCGFYYSDNWISIARQNIDFIPKGDFSVSVVLTLNENSEEFSSSKQDKAVLQIGYGREDELIKNHAEKGTIYATFNKFSLEVSEPVEKDGLYFFPIHNNSEYSVMAAGSISGDLVIPPYVDGKPVTEILRNGFSNLPDLTSVIIPDSIRRIDGFAFHECEKLASVTFCENSELKSIGEYAFACDHQVGISNKLTSIMLPDTVTSIETGAFYRCENLTNVVIGKNVNSIGVHAFLGCGKLTNVTIKAINPPKLPERASTDPNDDRFKEWFEHNDPGRFFYVPNANNYKNAAGWDQFQNCIFSFAEYTKIWSLTDWIKDKTAWIEGDNYLMSPLQLAGNPDIAFINNGIEITNRKYGEDNYHTIDLLLTGENSLNLNLNKDILKVTLYGFLLRDVNNAFVGIQRPESPFPHYDQTELTGYNPSFKLVWEQGSQIADIYDCYRIRLGTGNANMRITLIEVEKIGERNLTEYTVTFIDSEGNNTFPNKTAFGGLALGELPKPPKRAGYTFMGWFDGDNKITAKTIISKNMYLTARWEFGDKFIIVVANPTTDTLFQTVGDWIDATKATFRYEDKDWWIVATTNVDNPWESPNPDIPPDIFNEIQELHNNGVTRLGYNFSNEQMIYDYLTLTYELIHISGDDTCSVVIRRTHDGGYGNDVNYPGLYGSNLITYEMSEFYNEWMSIIKNSSGNNYNGGSNKGVFLLRITEIKFTMEDPRIP